MKKSLLASLIGISIIFSIDSLSRVVISLYNTQEIFMFSYTEYTRFWPVLLVAISAFSTFFGAMFALTYGREKQVFTLILFIILAGSFRFGQIVILNNTEGRLLFPVVALVLSLITIFLAWKLVRPSKTTKDPGDSGTSPTPPKHHHHSAGDDRQHNQPQ